MRERIGTYRWLIMAALVFCLCAGGSAPMARAAFWTYGGQLDGVGRQVYDALERIPDLLEYGSGEGQGIEISLREPFPASEGGELLSACRKAGDAFLKDHSELFWISSFRYGFSAGADAGQIGSVTLFPRDCYPGIRSEVPAARRALAAAVRHVAACRGRYARVKAAHDYVAKLITYGRAGEDRPSSHTVTGALLSKYRHIGVCEAYAKLFDILCKANGIPSVLAVGGEKKGGAVQLSHMWNYVQMEDGRWYLVDVTNDDQKGGLLHRYLLAGSGTPGLNGKKAGEDHTASGRLSAADYPPFRLPVLCARAYRGIPTVKLALAKTQVTLRRGERYRLPVLRSPAAADDALTYRSSCPGVAAVSPSGTVTALRAGRAVVTVRTAGGKRAVIRVTVRSSPAQGSRAAHSGS